MSTEITTPVEAAVAPTTPEQTVETPSLNTMYNKLFRDGKLLQLHIYKWSMATQLNEEDLPLSEGSKVPAFAKLGIKRLIDPAEQKKFLQIETKARTYLRKHALQFPIAQAHFVPNKKIIAVLDKLEEYRREYNGVTEAFVTNYPQHKEAMLTVHAEHRELLEPCYPPVENIRGQFGFSIGMFEVAFPETMKEINLASVQAESSEREAASRRMRQELDKQYANNVAQLNGFFRDALARNRGQIIETFEVIANKIRTKSVVSATNVKTMTNIIEAFDGLDLLDDKVVRSKLDAVRGLIAGGRDFKNDSEALASLGTAVNNLLTVARDTSDIDTVTGDYVRRIEV